MGQIKTQQDIKQLGTILSVWAHPDDESFSCGGIMAAAVHNGQQVICVTATKGEAGVQDESRWPAAKLAEIRANELEKACKVLGVTKHHWLGYHDGQCQAVATDEAVQQLKDLIQTYKPDTILTFGPDGMTGHPDHQTVSAWVMEATKGTDVQVYHAVAEQTTYDKYLKGLDEQFNIYFNIDQPPLKQAAVCDIALQLTPELVEQKFEALAAMPSQTEAMLKTLPADSHDSVFDLECFVKSS